MSQEKADRVNPVDPVGAVERSQRAAARRAEKGIVISPENCPALGILKENLANAVDLCLEETEL